MKLTVVTIALVLFANMIMAEVNLQGDEDVVLNSNSKLTKNNPEKSNQESNALIKLKMVGNLYIAPENWSKVGMSDDSKFGLGLGCMIGLGLKIDDMVVGVGPHIGINRWEADYSKKAQSATSSVFYELTDTGIEGVFSMMFGKSKMAIILGKGKTNISSGYVVNGQTIPYPDTDKKTENYTNVGIAFYLGKFQIAPNYVRYTGVIKDAERLEIRLGFAF